MMLEKEFNSGNSKVKVSHWACCKEMHEAGGFHYPCCLKLTGVKKWLSVKRDITKNHNIVVNFSDSHSHYIYAYRYVCKSDTEVAHSPGHPDLSEVGSPRTKASTAAHREGSRKPDLHHQIRRNAQAAKSRGALAILKFVIMLSKTTFTIYRSYLQKQIRVSKKVNAIWRFSCFPVLRKH
eukprot:gene6582-7325_t